MILNWFKQHKTEVWIFLLAFGVRFLYAIFVQFKFGSHGFLAYSDAFSFYLPLAKNLIENGIFSMYSAPPYVPDAYRTPLYPLFIAGFLWLKLPLFAIIFAQNIMAGVMAVLIYRIGILIFDPPAGGRNIGLFTAILMSLEPMSIYWNNLLMSDYLFALLFVLAFYYFILKRYYLFAFIFGLAALTRSIGFYWFPVFLLFLLLSNPIAKWKNVFFAILIFLTVLFPWVLRNKTVFDTWQLSSASWYNLYPNVTGQFAEYNGFTLPLPVGDLYDPTHIPFYKEHFWEIFSAQPLGYLKFYTSLVLKSLSKNPYFYLTNYVLKPKLPQFFYGNIEKLISAAAVALWVVWAAIYLLALLSFFEKKRRFWFVLIFLIFWANAASVGALGLGADMSRYILPLAPFIFLFAGAGIGIIYNKFKYAV